VLKNLRFYIVLSPSRKREALAARSQMGRWTYTFTRCPVSVAAYSETKMSLNNKVARVETAVRSRDALQQKKGDLGYENYPTRRYLPCTQARSWSYQPVDVVSPINATGHP
jgi:hypothetical protein